MSDQYEDEDDIILSELPTDELVEQMQDDLYDGLAEEVAEGTQILLDRGWEATRVLEEALVAGMTVVGVDFRDGVLFVPEVLMAANAMKAGMALLQPLLARSAAAGGGATIVLGTVKGDLHDIGKNLVGMMLKGANFEIVDLGTNVAPEAFAEAVNEHGADVVGISALLTTTMVGMKAAVEAVRAADPKAKILVGGAPVTDEFAAEIGADGFAKDAATAATVAQELLA